MNCFASFVTVMYPYRNPLTNSVQAGTANSSADRNADNAADFRTLCKVVLPATSSFKGLSHVSQPLHLFRPAFLWKNLPNFISCARLCATAVLLASVFLHRIELFKWLLLACLLSDIVDGLIARTFHLTTQLGAFLDSLADVATMFAAVLGTLVFQRIFVTEHYTGLLLVIGLYIAEIIASLWRYGRVSSFHTVLARVAAFTAGVFVMSLFIWGYQAWLYQKTIAIYVIALSEEMLLIYLLPEWHNDVGGIHRLLANPVAFGRSRHIRAETKPADWP
jgi:CDP-diacylglycerol--glycerol-3-phosphate 3-phosphatidyltransferase